MSKNADAIIIGAGVIGAACAFELAKLGYKTITVDRNHDAGTGSTGGSCAIVRVHYSTLAGAAFAYEGYFYWRDWADYLEVQDEQGAARFVECGCLVMATEANHFLEKHKGFCQELGIPFEEWTESESGRGCPFTIWRASPRQSAWRIQASEKAMAAPSRRACFSRPRAMSPTRSSPLITSAEPPKPKDRGSASTRPSPKSFARMAVSPASSWPAERPSTHRWC
jgi:glycine/D-amino acid oxidase-like deaminating enzyme